MKLAMDETSRRRTLQDEYNQERGIIPTTIQKAIPERITPLNEDGTREKMSQQEQKAMLAKRALRTGRGSGHGKGLWTAAESPQLAMANLDLLDAGERINEIKSAAGDHFDKIENLPKMISKMEGEMKEAAKAMQFERAAELRDRVKRLKILSLGL